MSPKSHLSILASAGITGFCHYACFYMGVGEIFSILMLK